LWDSLVVVVVWFSPRLAGRSCLLEVDIARFAAEYCTTMYCTTTPGGFESVWEVRETLWGSR
jgi:hypothetical protein